MDSLTDQQRAMIDLEREWWATPGGKETAIRERFGMSPVRYYQLLSQLLAVPAALAHDPVTINRLRRIRSARHRRVAG
ncbi:hypothetical protein MM1218R_01454 [Mycobacterium marinum]|uniref:DUF3263 domain-containing protein n=1 Tax=Mycobacterium marinum TaxID=1781 RepID=UPI000E28BF9A|nr:DUF3263 domain-containing protein [Mycobacterium marinum]AXN43402.1 hypothetical protein MM1218R_01454 [Mycobacterium marinum]RFZ11545.1 hypothetical protein DE4381_01133 [Mycobacterium marinum]